MPAAAYDIKVEQGANWTLSVQWPRGAPTDLSTGWSAKAQVRASPTDVTALLTLDPYITLSAGSSTLPNIVIATPFDFWNSLIPEGHYLWDLLIVRTSDAFHKYLLSGRVFMVQRVSR